VTYPIARSPLESATSAPYFKILLRRFPALYLSSSFCLKTADEPAGRIDFQEASSITDSLALMMGFPPLLSKSIILATNMLLSAMCFTAFPARSSVISQMGRNPN